jgi:malonyl-CoA O-methyltransferase
MKITIFKKDPPVLNPLEGYNRWAQTYTTESNPVKDASNQLIEKMLPDLKNLNVLDAGCGAGHFCVLAEQRGAAKITGLDFSSAMIAVAKKNCSRTTLVEGDICKTDFPALSTDLVICALVVGHIENLSRALRQLTAPLKNGGLLLLSEFHPFLTINKKKRTFRDPSGKVFEISHHLHLFQEYINELAKLDMVVEELQESVWNDMPVVFALKARKKNS